MLLLKWNFRPVRSSRICEAWVSTPFIVGNASQRGPPPPLNRFKNRNNNILRFLNRFSDCKGQQWPSSSAGVFYKTTNHTCKDIHDQLLSLSLPLEHSKVAELIQGHQFHWLSLPQDSLHNKKSMSPCKLCYQTTTQKCSKGSEILSP